MKTAGTIVYIIIAFACNNKKPNSIEYITENQSQNSIFTKLVTIANPSLDAQALNDSLAFLLLPVQASCPSCRKKTIDSLMSHQNKIPGDHFVIICASAGRKTINGYFLEQDYELPEIPGKLFLDSMNLAGKSDLCRDKPTIYYAYNQKVFKKVSAVPATVREDLREFFSGVREN